MFDIYLDVYPFPSLCLARLTEISYKAGFLTRLTQYREGMIPFEEIPEVTRTFARLIISMIEEGGCH